MKNKEQRSVSSISILKDIEAERKRAGKKPLGRGNSCSGAGGSWKNLKK